MTTGPPFDPSTAAVGNDLALRTALGCLDEVDALVLSLVYVDGLTLAQVAAVRREPVDVVGRRLAHAMIELGRALLDGRP